MIGGFGVKAVERYDQNLIGKIVFIKDIFGEEISGKVLDYIVMETGEAFLSVQQTLTNTIVVPVYEISIIFSRK